MTLRSSFGISFKPNNYLEVTTADLKQKLQSIDTTKAVILGDMFELGNKSIDEHKKIVKLLSSKNIDSCYFIGEDFYKVKSTNE